MGQDACAHSNAKTNWLKDIVQELDKLGVIWEPNVTKKNHSDETFESRLDELKALVAFRWQGEEDKSV